MGIRNVTHVEGLIFAIVGKEILLCFVLPSVAVRKGFYNHTIPGGRIQKLGGRRYEHVESAMLRELKEEVGVTSENVSVLSGIGAPRPHLTGLGEVKLIQGFAGIVCEPCIQTHFVDEITAVTWKTPDKWDKTLATMNKNKRQLVLHLMQEAIQLKRMYPCIKRELTRFLEQFDTRPLQQVA